MKRWFGKLLCLLLALALTVSGWLGFVLAQPDHMGGSIAATMRTKVRLLQDTQSGGPRILFAGGSSSPYGTVCRTAADATGYTALDVGATAYLGLDYYLALLGRYARAGDVIVLAPEHMMLEGPCVDYSLVWQAAGNDAEVWRTVPLSYLPGLFAASDDALRLRRETADKPDSGCRPDFGPLGDVTAPRETLLESGWNTQDPVYLDAGRFDPAMIEKINAFAARMEKRGARVYFAFAPLDEKAIQSSPAEVDAYAAAVTAALDIPVILTERQAILPARYFYDSNNHLTSEGAALNTQNLIDGLRAQGIGA